MKFTTSSWSPNQNHRWSWWCPDHSGGSRGFWSKENLQFCSSADCCLWFLFLRDVSRVVDGAHVQLNSSECITVELVADRTNASKVKSQIRKSKLKKELLWTAHFPVLLSTFCSGSSSFDSQKVGPSISVTSPMSPSIVSGQVSVSIPSMRFTASGHTHSSQLTAVFHGDVYVSDCKQASSGSQNSGNRRCLEEWDVCTFSC